MDQNKKSNNFKVIGKFLVRKGVLFTLIMSFSQLGMAELEAPVKLNGPLAMYGEVKEAKFSPDSQTVVYLASQQTVGVEELFSVPADGGTAIKLNPQLVSGGDVLSNFVITDDGLNVVYLADQDINGVTELYSVPITGGVSVKLNQPLVIDGDVANFKVSADSSRVVYRADQDADGVIELYSVAISGGAVVKINNSLVLNGDVRAYLISADSSRVVYVADEEVDEVQELFSALITGGGATKLNAALTGIQDVLEFEANGAGFEVSPDSLHVVYTVFTGNFQEREVFSVPIAGGAVVRLNGSLSTNGRVNGYQISADSQRVVYMANEDGPFLLYSVLISGGDNIELVPSVFFESVVDFEINPNSNKVVFDWRNDLWSVPILGGALPTKISSNEGANPWRVRDLRISPDGEWVVYQQLGSGLSLYALVIDGASAPIRLSNDFAHSNVREMSDVRISSDSKRVLYRADQLVNNQMDLFTTPIGGGTNKQVNNAPAVLEADVITSAFSPDGQQIIYIADQGTMDQTELFSVAYNVPPPPVADDGKTCFPIKAANAKVILICL